MLFLHHRLSFDQVIIYSRRFLCYNEDILISFTDMEVIGNFLTVIQETAYDMTNKKYIRSGILFLSLLLAVVIFILPASAADLKASDIQATNAFVLDAATGEELWSKDPDTQRVPASLTKLMSVYLIYEAMDAGQFTLNSKVPISSAASSLALNGTYSNVPLYTSGTYTVNELLDAVIITSACGATKALAEFVAGSESAFVTLMNQTAAALGINCYFYDCFGGNSSNRITARGIATLAYHLIKEHPDYLVHSRKASYYFHGATYYSTNQFVKGTYSCNGTVDGMKTGTTNAAGRCFVATAYDSKYRVISVVLNASSDYNRFNDTKTLINYGLKVLNERPEKAECVEPFVDVPLNQYYSDSVAWAVQNSIVHGMTETTFEPDRVCTRAQVVTILWRVAGAPEPTTTETVFTDLDENSYYYKAVLWAYENGITNGISEQIFSPEDTCVRGQIVTFLHRFANLPATGDAETTFTDIDPDSFYYDAVLWAAETGITNGTSETTFSPELNCTRAQAITFLYRLQNAA